MIFFTLISGAFGSELKMQTNQPLFNVGYQIIDFKYTKDGKEQNLTAAVWYPTAEQPKLYNYGGPTKGSVAVDAAPFTKNGSYPLLVFSHGYGGSGLSAIFLTEQLAARGWIVVAPDHHDRHSATRIRSGRNKNFDRSGFWQHAREIASSTPEDREKYLYRLDEMKLALNSILNHHLFGEIINTDKIVLGGHSFGGFTALGLCGTDQKYYDTRIKAVLLFSTGAGGYLFTKEELRRVRIPSMLFMGEKERNQYRGTRTMVEVAEKIYKSMSPPKYFLEVKGANHFSFNNHFGNNRLAGILSGTEEMFEVIRQYSIAFLENHAEGKKGAGRALERSHPMLIRYDKE